MRRTALRRGSRCCELELELGLPDDQLSLWGHIGGSGNPPPHVTPATALGFSDREDHAVAVELGELDPGDEYCAQLVAFNASGFAASAKVVFTLGAPTVESLSPASGLVSGGETVTITGENLGGASAVHFGSADASIVRVALDEVVVSSPAHEPGAVDVTVTTPTGTSVDLAGRPLHLRRRPRPHRPDRPDGIDRLDGSRRIHRVNRLDRLHELHGLDEWGSAGRGHKRAGGRGR